MGKLFGLRAYLSGPMEKTNDFGRELRRPIAEILLSKGVIVLDPSMKDLFTPWVNLDGSDLQIYREEGNLNILHQKMKQIRKLDLDLVGLSDFLVVVFDPDISTVGTWEEIHEALVYGKPVLFLCEKGYDKIPLWVYGMIPPEMLFSSLSSLSSYLTDLDEGRLHSNFWRQVFDNQQYL